MDILLMKIKIFLFLFLFLFLKNPFVECEGVRGESWLEGIEGWSGKCGKGRRRVLSDVVGRVVGRGSRSRGQWISRMERRPRAPLPRMFPLHQLSRPPPESFVYVPS